MSIKKALSILWIIVGIALLVGGVILKIPGGVLTTYKSMNDVETSSYSFDNRYSSIDEYVGGDAYNYIIGAALVAGKTSGTMVSKAMCIVSGVICICVGATLMVFYQESDEKEQHEDDSASAM